MSEETETPVAEKILENLEEEVDVIEQKLDELEAPTGLINEDSSPIVPFAITIGVVAAVAATGGYFFAKFRLRTRYEAIAEKEIAEAKEFYARLGKVEGYSTPEEAITKLHPEKEGDVSPVPAVEALKKYQGHGKGPDILEEDPDMPPDEDEEEEEGENVNVFLNSVEDDEDWDWEREKASRSKDKPYVITHEEFAMGEAGYEQATVFYYEGDGVATDEHEKPLHVPMKQLGAENLARFGTMSRDENIVYIRNDFLELDMEVVRQPGKYVDEVLGFRHADEPFSYRRKGSFNGDQ